MDRRSFNCVHKVSTIPVPIERCTFTSWRKYETFLMHFPISAFLSNFSHNWKMEWSIFAFKYFMYFISITVSWFYFIYVPVVISKDNTYRCILTKIIFPQFCQNIYVRDKHMGHGPPITFWLRPLLFLDIIYNIVLNRTWCHSNNKILSSQCLWK
jgi:hypothetical protein